MEQSHGAILRKEYSHLPMDAMIGYPNALKTHESALGHSLLSKRDIEGLRVFATTVLRGACDRELTGYLLELDWRRNIVKRQIPIPIKSSHPFWNARGGNRGGRGLFVHGGILYVATALTIYHLIRIRPMPEQVVVFDEKHSSPHNGILTGDGEVIINDTQNQRLCLYSLDDGKVLSTKNTPVHGEIASCSQQFSSPGWQRGLSHVKRSVYLVGTSPASVFEVDIKSGTIGQICQIDNDINHCIHGLTATYHL